MSNLFGKTGMQNDSGKRECRMTNEASKGEDLVSNEAGVHSLITNVYAKELEDQTLCRLANSNGNPRKRRAFKVEERNSGAWWLAFVVELRVY